MTLREQLIARGYRIIPNKDKRAALKGWNTAEFDARERGRVATWARRWPDLTATGLVICDGVVAIDLDIDDEAAIAEMLLAFAEIAPEVAARAPTRFGRGAKLALFARLAPGEELFRRIPAASRKYGGHQVEVFAGKPTSRGYASHQFGIYGPHTVKDDGTVEIEYDWAHGYPALHEIDAKDLPVITTKQVYATVEAFERLAERRGWELEVKPATDTGPVAYDITEDTRFETNRGGVGISYAELCDEYEVYGDALRCSSNFIPGRGLERKANYLERCSVGDANRHHCVAVYVHGDAATHFPAALAPGAAVDGLGDILREDGVEVDTDPVWRECYKGGFPKPSLHNAILAVEAIGAQCSKDTFHDRLIMDGDQVTDIAIRALRVRLSNRFGLDFTETHLSDAVSILCEAHAFDPIAGMLEEAEANWDGVARLDQMGPLYFQTEDTPLSRQCVRKTMIAAVARVRQPGIKFDTILTMESPEGLNKSSAWAVLAGAGNFSDERIIGKDSREVQELLRGVWIHESSDLAGLTKAEVETVKAFASRTSDRARPAYGRHLVDQPRRSVEVATTNDTAYLLSQTGNRRFWPVKVKGMIDLGRLAEDRLQLWGEAAHYQSQGESLVLDEALWPVAGVEQEARRVRHPWEDILQKMARVPTVGPSAGIGASEHRVIYRELNEERVASADIFNHVLKIPNGQLHNGHSKTLASVMRTLGWEHGTFRQGEGPVKGYKRTVVTEVTGNRGVPKDPIVILYPPRDAP